MVDLELERKQERLGPTDPRRSGWPRVVRR